MCLINFFTKILATMTFPSDIFVYRILQQCDCDRQFTLAKSPWKKKTREASRSGRRRNTSKVDTRWCGFVYRRKSGAPQDKSHPAHLTRG